MVWDGIGLKPLSERRIVQLIPFDWSIEDGTSCLLHTRHDKMLCFVSSGTLARPHMPSPSKVDSSVAPNLVHYAVRGPAFRGMRSSGA